MIAKRKQNQITRQLEEIQRLLKNKDDRPLNFVEAAQYLSLSHSTLYKLTYQRKIPCYKPNGKYLYFYKHELDEWIFSKSKVKSEKSKEMQSDEDEEDPPSLKLRRASSEADASTKIKEKG